MLPIVALILTVLISSCSDSKSDEKEFEVKDSIRIVNARYYNVFTGKTSVSVEFELGNFWDKTKTYKYRNFYLIDKTDNVMSPTWLSSGKSQSKVAPLVWEEIGLIYEMSNKLDVDSLRLVYAIGKEIFNVIYFTPSKGKFSFWQ